MAQISSNIYYRDEAALNLISQLMEQNKDNHGNIKLISDRLDTLENSNLLSVSGISDNYHIKIDENKAIQSFLEEGSDELLGGGPVEGFIFNNISYLNINTKTTISHVSDVAGVIEGEIIKSSVITGEILSFNTKKYLHLSTGGLRGTNNQNKGITVTSDGRVGIGIVKPEEDLEIDGSIQIDSANVARLKFQQSGQNPHALGEIDALGDTEGGDGGAIVFYTKIDGQQGNAAVTEKIRINNVGAIGIEGPVYGNPGQVLSSNGNAAVSWEDQTDTTYTTGPNMTLNGTVFDIPQSVAIDATPTFNGLGVNGTVDCVESLFDSARTRAVANYNVYDRRSYEFLIGPDGPYPVHSLLNGRINAENIQGLGDTVETNSYVFIQRCDIGLLEGSTSNQFSSQQTYIVVRANGVPYHFYGSHPYNVVSDDRLKHNEEHLTNCLDTIRKLKPQKYQKTNEMKDADYNGELEDGTWVYEAGLIAQEVMEIPELNWCVNGGGMGRRLPTDPETEQPYIVGYSNILMYHLQATKELDTLVQQQRNLIDNLRAENETIKAALNELLTESGRASI